MNKTSKKIIAEMIAGILMKDIKLNAEAASSIHIYDAPQPNEIEKYKKNHAS